MVFDINKDYYFNSEEFEIQLSEESEEKYENIDFSKYSYVAMEGFLKKIL
ncbi:MAG: hypothetical protein ACK5MD_05235 [Flavobacteriales bacterium]